MKNLKMGRKTKTKATEKSQSTKKRKKLVPNLSKKYPTKFTDLRRLTLPNGIFKKGRISECASRSNDGPEVAVRRNDDLQGLLLLAKGQDIASGGCSVISKAENRNKIKHTGNRNMIVHAEDQEMIAHVQKETRKRALEGTQRQASGDIFERHDDLETECNSDNELCIAKEIVQALSFPLKMMLEKIKSEPPDCDRDKPRFNYSVNTLKIQEQFLTNSFVYFLSDEDCGGHKEFVFRPEQVCKSSTFQNNVTNAGESPTVCYNAKIVSDYKHWLSGLKPDHNNIVKEYKKNHYNFVKFAIEYKDESSFSFDSIKAANDSRMKGINDSLNEDSDIHDTPRQFFQCKMY